MLKPFVDVFFKVGVHENSAVFTGKHLCWSLLLIKLQACNFVKKKLRLNYFTVYNA